MNTVVINMDMLASRGIEALEGLWASLIWQARAPGFPFDDHECIG